VPPPLTLRLAIVAVLVETALVTGYVAVLVYADAGEPGGWRVIGYFALYAIAFIGLSWALIRRRRWVRAPLIVLQLLLLATGLGLLGGGSPLGGVAVIALAVAVTGLLLAPATRQALSGDVPRERV
jgi:hypothetical protein